MFSTNYEKGIHPAYLAGFIDGERYIEFRIKTSNSKTRYRIQITNTHLGVLNLIQQKYGGNYCNRVDNLSDYHQQKRGRRMKKMLLLVVILCMVEVNAYTFSYPTPYYYHKENIKVNLSFIERFENFTPLYLRDHLDIEFTTQPGTYDGYAHCFDNKDYVQITIYRGGWENYDYDYTSWLLEHELKHAYQCKILREFPHHYNMDDVKLR